MWGHEAHHRDTTLTTHRAQDQMSSNYCLRVPESRRARTTLRSARHHQGVEPTHHHTHTPQPSQERKAGARPKPELKHTHEHRRPQRGLPGHRRSAHTYTHSPNPARNGGLNTKPEPKHTHHKPQPGCSQTPQPNTRTADYSQEWRSTSGARTQTYAPNTPARNGGAQPKPQPKQTHQHRTP